jgi:hypothetical protein
MQLSRIWSFVFQAQPDLHIYSPEGFIMVLNGRMFFANCRLSTRNRFTIVNWYFYLPAALAMAACWNGGGGPRSLKL